MLTTERFERPCAGANLCRERRRQKRQFTDLVSLLRFALGLDGELKPLPTKVDKRFQAWTFRHNASAHGV